MVQLKDASGGMMWDFDVERTLSIFGVPGAGKTNLARHVVRTWLDAGGVVLAGNGWDGIDYRDLPVHLKSPDEAVQYGRHADETGRDQNLLIVIDPLERLSEENLDYLQRRPVTHVRWVVISRDPRPGSQFESIGMGRMTTASFRMAFGSALDDRDASKMRQRGVAAQRSTDGGVIEQIVPFEDVLSAPRTSDALRLPLPTFPNRVWYASLPVAHPPASW